MNDLKEKPKRKKARRKKKTRRENRKFLSIDTDLVDEIRKLRDYIGRNSTNEIITTLIEEVGSSVMEKNKIQKLDICEYKKITCSSELVEVLHNMKNVISKNTEEYFNKKKFKNKYSYTYNDVLYALLQEYHNLLRRQKREIYEKRRKTKEIK